MVFERVLGCMLKDPHNGLGHRFSRPSHRAVSIGVNTTTQRASPTGNLGLGLGLGLASTPSLAGCTGWIPRALVMPGPHLHQKKKARYGTRMDNPMSKKPQFLHILALVRRVVPRWSFFSIAQLGILGPTQARCKWYGFG